MTYKSSSPAGGPIFIPPNFGSNLRSKLAAAPNKGKIAIVGDSVTHGYYASNLDTKSWPGLLKARLQGVFGDGGSGWKGVVDSVPWMTAAGIGSQAQTAYAAAGNLFTLTGTWSNYGATTFGIGGASIYCAAAATATITVRGTIVRVFDIGGTYTVSIDGGAAVQVSGVYQTVHMREFTGLAPGNHTVVISWVSGTVYLNGVTGENASGLVIDKFTKYGAMAGYVGRPSGSLYDQRGMGGYLYPADLVVWNLGLNDAAAGTPTTADAYMQSFRAYLDAVRDGAAPYGVQDVLIVMSHAGKYDQTSGRNFQSYCAAMRVLAMEFGAAYVDLWETWQQSYNLAAAQNYWGNAVTPGAPGSDAVHVSDAGAQFSYDTINKVFASAIG